MSHSQACCTWRALLVVLFLLGVVAEHHRQLANRRVLAEASASVGRVQREVLAIWTEEDLRAEVRRLRRWCWTWAAVLVLVGVPLFVFDLVTGGLGHAAP